MYRIDQWIKEVTMEKRFQRLLWIVPVLVLSASPHAGRRVVIVVAADCQ
jgi:hypothetical protein